MLNIVILGSIMVGIYVWIMKGEGKSTELSIYVSLLIMLVGVLLWEKKLIKGYGMLDVDGLNINMIVLTVVLLPICILLEQGTKKGKELLGMYLILEGVILGVFYVNDILSFFILFEGVLIPMFILVGGLGKRERRSRAGIKLLLYTLVGSVWFLLGVLICNLEMGGVMSNDVLRIVGLKGDISGYVWLLVFIGMMVKVPLMPLHLWLGEAHVEASTSGSVLLAGVLLKLGGYGIIRYNVNVLGISSGMYYLDVIRVICIIGVIYGGLISLRQSDMKRVIAYGSISHMSLIVLSILSDSMEGISGGVLQMVSHGVVSSGLFISVGVMYDRIGSREVSYISGLMSKMPLLGFLFSLLTLGNIGLPGTSGFVGEILCLKGSFNINVIIGLMGSSTMVISVCYSLWLFVRSVYGNLKKGNVESVRDVNGGELVSLIILVLLMIILGVYPSICTDMLFTMCKDDVKDVSVKNSIRGNDNKSGSIDLDLRRELEEEVKKDISDKRRLSYVSSPKMLDKLRNCDKCESWDVGEKEYMYIGNELFGISSLARYIISMGEDFNLKVKKGDVLGRREEEIENICRNMYRNVKWEVIREDAIEWFKGKDEYKEGMMSVIKFEDTVNVDSLNVEILGKGMSEEEMDVKILEIFLTREIGSISREELWMMLFKEHKKKWSVVRKMWLHLYCKKCYILAYKGLEEVNNMSKVEYNNKIIRTHNKIKECEKCNELAKESVFDSSKIRNVVNKEMIISILRRELMYRDLLEKKDRENKNWWKGYRNER